MPWESHDLSVISLHTEEKAKYVDTCVSGCDVARSAAPDRCPGSTEIMGVDITPETQSWLDRTCQKQTGGYFYVLGPTE